MKKTVMGLVLLLTFSSTSHAVPTLQIGVPGASPGSYAPYVNSSNPNETDTAITTGNIIVVGGVQAQNAVHLGGAYGGRDWSTAVNGTTPAAFDSHGALLLITYSADALASSSLKISTDGGNSYHSSDVAYSSLFFPNEHSPLHDGTVSGYAYFDIGNFGFAGTVANFADPGESPANGELKEILLQFTGINWAHFDVMALETKETGNQEIRTTWNFENNPGSHDVTWHPNTPVPEPGTVTLVGLGLAGLALYKRRNRK